MATLEARRRTRRAGGVSMSVPRAVTASATRAIDQPKPSSSTRVPQWQIDALAYYDQIGAVRYSAQFAARALAKIRWFPAVRGDDGEAKESEDPTLVGLFDRVQDPGGGRTSMCFTFGQLDFLVGESYLLWTQADPEETDGEETWEVVSGLELKKHGKRGSDQVWHRISAPGLTPDELLEAEDGDFEPIGDNVRVYRWWRKHPAYSQMADSPMRSVLGDCEEIVRATHSINARLISRLSGPGILCIPQSWSMKTPPQIVGEENPEEDPFQLRLTQAMVTAIGKPGSAESVAPILVRVPDPQPGQRLDDMWSLIKIWNPDEVIRELELREKALQRYAVGVDMPPEKVMGLSISGSQHWNAWMVDEDAWAHIDPVAQAFADNLASSYLRVAARDEGFTDWQNVCVGYDEAAVVTNPDGFADAKELHDRLVVSDEYLRAQGNAGDEDRITDDDEMARRILLKTNQDVEVQGGAVEAKPTITPVPAVPQEQPSPNGRPPTGGDTDRDQPDEGMSAGCWRIIGAAEASIEEIRSRIGGRLRNHLAGRCAACVEQVQGVRSGMVAATLGPDLVMEHGPDLVGLAIDGGQHFVEAAIRMGVSHTQAQALAEVLELHVVHTIYERAPDLPAGFVGRVRALGVAA